MTTLEIILLILGAVIFVGSFIVPESKNEFEEEDRQLTREQIQEMLKKEVSDVRTQVEEMVDETTSYSMEKTERALERIVYEKTQEIKEYSDTVLAQINSNHQQAVFLYDMLNDKHENLKQATSEATKAVKEATEVVQEADIVKKEVAEVTQVLDEAFKPMDFSGIEKLKEHAVEPVREPEEPKMAEPSDISLQFDAMQGTAESNKDRILELYKKGKSNVAIAKELGLGVGEVKLVIGLYKGM